MRPYVRTDPPGHRPFYFIVSCATSCKELIQHDGLECARFRFSSPRPGSRRARARAVFALSPVGALQPHQPCDLGDLWRPLRPEHYRMAGDRGVGPLSGPVGERGRRPHGDGQGRGEPRGGQADRRRSAGPRNPRRRPPPLGPDPERGRLPDLRRGRPHRAGVRGSPAGGLRRGRPRPALSRAGRPGGRRAPRRSRTRGDGEGRRAAVGHDGRCDLGRRYRADAGCPDRARRGRNPDLLNSGRQRQRSACGPSICLR